MSFRLLENTIPSQLREWGPPALGLAVGMAMSWLVVPAGPVHGLSWLASWVVATRCTIPVFVITAVTVWLASRKRSILGTVLDTACLASWFPALIIFYHRDSPWAGAIAGVLAIVITRAVLVRYMAAAVPIPSRFACLSGAVALQASLVAIATEEWQASVFALAAALMIATWIVTAHFIWRSSMRTWKLRLVPAVLLGVSFSAGGLGPWSAQAHGNADRPPPRLQEAESGTRQIVIGESYPAVLLWPDVDDHVTLVPPLPARGRKLFATKEVDSLSIPFYGAYWYYKGPGELPRHPFVTHGDPAKMSFRSTDLGPLTMEARQNLGRHVDVSCCREIGVAIRNGDRHPETVALDLAIRDSAYPDRAAQWLGEERVTSAATQTLSFPMIRAAGMDQFDEITVRFHLNEPRSDRSARVAIRRFIFLR